MSSKKTRRILCLAISFAMTVTICISCLIIGAKATAFNYDTINNSVKKSDVASVSHQKMMSELSKLAEKSEIPISVFESVFSIENVYTAESEMIKAAFEGRNYYNAGAELQKNLYNKFIEFYNSNGVGVTSEIENNLKSLAEKSTDIYNAYIDIGVIKSFASAVSSMNFNATKVLSLALLASVGFYALMCVLYGKKLMYRASSFLSSSLIASGFVQIVLSIALMIKGLDGFVSISPEIYLKALSGVFTRFNVIVMIFGFALLLIGFAMYAYIYKAKILKREKKMRGHSSHRTYVKFFDGKDDDYDDRHLEKAPEGTE